jgi:hypothetical protein
VALKTVLTAAYLLFVAICIRIGRELGASRRLDAYYAVPFFGFAYGWGMYTFLVSSAVGLGFVWLCLRYARGRRPGLGLAVAGLGLILLFSHGLVFMLACAIGGILLLCNARSLGDLVVRSWPFVVLFVACVVMLIVTHNREAAIASDFAAQVSMGPLHMRIHNIIDGPFDLPQGYWSKAFFAAFAILPLLGGLRVDRSRVESLAIFGVTIAVLFLAPSFVFATAGVSERFPLFLLPAYAWLFAPRASVSRAPLALFTPPRLGLAVIAVSGLVLMQHAITTAKFAREDKDFATILARAEPGQRALSMVFTRESSAPLKPDVYLHFPLWYEAEKHGFVEYNFAVEPPEIVRYNKPAVDRITQSFAWNPGTIDWDHRAPTYRYLFIRHAHPLPSTLFAGTHCAPALVATSGLWDLMDSHACAGAPAAQSAAAPPSA